MTPDVKAEFVGFKNTVSDEIKNIQGDEFLITAKQIYLNISALIQSNDRLSDQDKLHFLEILKKANNNQLQSKNIYPASDGERSEADTKFFSNVVDALKPLGDALQNVPGFLSWETTKQSHQFLGQMNLLYRNILSSQTKKSMPSIMLMGSILTEAAHEVTLKLSQIADNKYLVALTSVNKDLENVITPQITGELMGSYSTIMRQEQVAAAKTSEIEAQKAEKEAADIAAQKEKRDKIIKILGVYDKTHKAIEDKNQWLDEYNAGRSNKVGHVMVGQITENDNLVSMFGHKTREELQQSLESKTLTDVSQLYVQVSDFKYEMAIEGAVNANKNSAMATAKEINAGKLAKAGSEIQQSLSKVAIVSIEPTKFPPASPVKIGNGAYADVLGIYKGQVKESVEKLREYQKGDDSWKKPTLGERIVGFFQKYLLGAKTSYERRMANTQTAINALNEYDKLKDSFHDLQANIISDVNDFSLKLHDYSQMVDRWKNNVAFADGEMLGSNMESLVQDAKAALTKYQGRYDAVVKELYLYGDASKSALQEVKENCGEKIEKLKQILGQAEQALESLNKPHIEGSATTLIQKLKNDTSEYKSLSEEKAKLDQKPQPSIDYAHSTALSSRGQRSPT